MGSRNICQKAEGINESRHGKYYIDTTAAAAVNGNTIKPNLPSCRSLSHLNLVATEGTGPATTFFLQVEECINCLHVLNNNRYGYAFLFDHSSGHAKNALEVWRLER